MDTSKHSMIFNRSLVTTPVTVIGLGAIGSAVALQLTKLGIHHLQLYDDDVVEYHNIPNQVLYTESEVDSPKVFAAKQRLQLFNEECKIEANRRFVVSKSHIDPVSHHVFLCVDSMAMRKRIFENVVHFNPRIHFFVDGRMGARHGMCYGFTPLNLDKSQEYLNRWYPDSDVDLEHVGGCSITPSVISTALFVATQMVWMFINHVMKQPHPEELAFRADNLEVTSKGQL